jgi:hypothetical protein
LIASSTPPRLDLPAGLDLDSPDAIFTLFISEDIFQRFSQSTNEYAAQQGQSQSKRAWKDTNINDIKVFFGILIYMGVNLLPCIPDYWQQDEEEALHRPRFCMGLKRFEQIRRYLHVSPPDQRPEHKQWWYKLEPLASSFDQAAQRYYQPGSNVSIDETMIRCFGRTKHTVKMPSKPIKQGYKIFALAEHGYIWTFTWSSRLWGIVDLFKYTGLSPTASMVMKMIKRLPMIADRLGPAGNPHTNPPVNSADLMANFLSNQPGNPYTIESANPHTNQLAYAADSIANSPANQRAVPYTVYIDNYFTSIALFKELRDIQCGAYGTTRPRGGILIN